MTDEIIEPREHYVYALLREDGITPFYIGIGNRHRWLRHEYEFDGRNPHKENIIKKMIRNGTDKVPKVKLLEGITRKMAAQVEIDLICLIGRHPKGPLVNMTSGGDGIADIPEESRRRQRQATLDRWAKDPNGMMKGLIAARETAQSDDARERRKESIRQSWQRQSRRDAIKPLDLTDQQRDKRRSNMNAIRDKLNATMTPERRKKRAERLKTTLATPEVKAKRSAASKAMWAARRDDILKKRERARQNTDPHQPKDESHG